MPSLSYSNEPRFVWLYDFNGAVRMKPDHLTGFDGPQTFRLNNQSNVKFPGDDGDMAKPTADLADESVSATEIRYPSNGHHSTDDDITVFKSRNIDWLFIIQRDDASSAFNQATPGDPNTPNAVRSVAGIQRETAGVALQLSDRQR